MTWAQKCQNVGVLIKINFKLITFNNLLVALVLLILVPFLQETNNLDAISAAYCLETYVAMIGIVMLVPLFYPEQVKEIQEIVASKEMPPYKVPFIRMIMALLSIVILVVISAFVLQVKGGVFPVASYIGGAFISALFLGSMGMLVSNLCNSTIIGYMASIGYLIMNMMTKDEFVGNFYLMSMTSSSFKEKYWLLAGSILCTAAAFAIKPLKRKLA